jgi:phosphate transport system ATP-binding protein
MAEPALKAAPAAPGRPDPTPAGGPPAFHVETEELTAMYGAFAAVKDVSLGFVPNRVHGRLSRTALDGIVERSLRQAALWDEVKDRLRASAMALSGGQQQRLCVARTIAPSPEVVLLDEPTASLDPQGTQRIEELLFELKRAFTIIIVTHNLQQAARVSDTTSFFYLGTMVETGPTRQIFTTPRDEQTEAYITGRFG